jgi:hypothetical protein
VMDILKFSLSGVRESFSFLAHFCHWISTFMRMRFWPEWDRILFMYLESMCHCVLCFITTIEWWMW